MNKSTVKSKRRPRTRKEVDMKENPDYGPGAEEVSPRRYTAASAQEATKGRNKGEETEEDAPQETSRCCTIM